MAILNGIRFDNLRGGGLTAAISAVPVALARGVASSAGLGSAMPFGFEYNNAA